MEDIVGEKVLDSEAADFDAVVVVENDWKFGFVGRDLAEGRCACCLSHSTCPLSMGWRGQLAYDHSRTRRHLSRTG